MKGMTPYENLANAIVIQACKDYRKAYKRFLRKERSAHNDTSELQELECFFRSNWYKTLTGIDGEYLMERLRQEVKA
jgi:hypothetical protein